ncbi:universal stress protein [Halosolutus gelatinilyticus]|uniref:universal stress protein n=1 Tax=Halosolutus gelatinilyticus TaxID=2931975 RepID=UPI001FF67EFA|nr:universal stress protein [Halosolutus gelatinilyticus]
MTRAPSRGFSSSICRLEIADEWDATISLLYVADTNESSQTRLGTEVVDVLEQEGEEIVSNARERVAERGVSVTTDIVQGIPHEAIVQYAATHDADLVVMGTHGRDGLERYVLGSVAERVVNRATIPVLTVRAADDVTTNYPYTAVLVPTVGSDHAMAALQRGADVANRNNATVHLLSVLEEPILGLGNDRSDRDERVRELLEEATSTVQNAGVDDVVTAVKSGSVPREIASYADSEGIDLIVMGTHGRTGIDQHLLGSITERVLRTASVPVLTTNRKNPS